MMETTPRGPADLTAPARNLAVVQPASRPQGRGLGEGCAPLGDSISLHVGDAGARLKGRGLEVERGGDRVAVMTLELFSACRSRHPGRCVQAPEPDMGRSPGGQIQVWAGSCTSRGRRLRGSRVEICAIHGMFSTGCSHRSPPHPPALQDGRWRERASPRVPGGRSHGCRRPAFARRLTGFEGLRSVPTPNIQASQTDGVPGSAAAKSRWISRPSLLQTPPPLAHGSWCQHPRS